MDPLPLDYELPSTRRKANEPRFKPAKVRTVCVVATIPVIVCLWAFVVDPLFRRWSGIRLDAVWILLIPAVAVCMGGWLALAIFELRGGAGSPLAMLTSRSARYVLAMLALFICFIPFDGGYNQHVVGWFLIAHVAILAYFLTKLVLRRLVGGAFVAAVIVGTIALGGFRVQWCPHSSSTRMFGALIQESGTPCNNPQRYRLWWLPDLK